MKSKHWPLSIDLPVLQVYNDIFPHTVVLGLETDNYDCLNTYCSVDCEPKRKSCALSFLLFIRDQDLVVKHIR